MSLVLFVNDDWMVGKCYSSVGPPPRFRRIKPNTQPRHIVCMFRYPCRQETECTQWVLMSQNSWIVLASHSGPSLALRVYPQWLSGGQYCILLLRSILRVLLLRGKGFCASDATYTSQFVTPNKFWSSRGIYGMFERARLLYRPGAHCRSAIWFCAKREHGGHVNSRRENWPHVPCANMPYKNNQLLFSFFFF